MTKNLSILLIALVLFPSFMLAQKNMIIRADGQKSSNGIFSDGIEVQSLQISKKAVRQYFKNHNNLTDFQTILNYIFPSTNNVNFGFSGHDWMVQWFEAPTDMYITKAGFNVNSMNTDHADVSLKLVKLNWSKDELLNSGVVNWGYYEATGNGVNDISAFMDNPDVTGGYIDVTGTGRVSPFGADLWSNNGIGLSVSPVLQSSSNSYQWVDMTDLNGDSVLVAGGTIVGVALFNDANTLGQGTIGILANTSLGIPGLKFYSEDSQVALGWWSISYTWDFALSVTLFGDLPPIVNSVDTIPQIIYSTGDRTVNANVTDPNAGDSVGIFSVKLMYSIDGDSTWMAIAMTGTEPDYKGTIPGQETGTHVDYYVVATDVTNNVSESEHYGYDIVAVKQQIMNINNITSWVGQDGFHNWLVGGGSWNGEFPNRANAGAIFSEGMVWGGKVTDGQNPLIRVDGNTYATGCKAITRIFRVRPDYQTADLTQDAADFFLKPISDVNDADIQNVRDIYATDWNEWPAGEGAIYDDVDGNGSYNPSIDIPGIPDAAQTIFIKYDDSNSENLYGSPPIGLEISETYWAYTSSEALSNTIFKKVDMVYKGIANSNPNSTIDSMYIVQWSDPDVGNSIDDFVGCDTTLNLGYAYNSSSLDAVYNGIGSPSPAVGYNFLQGVSKYTGNPVDSAIFNLKWRKGYKYVNHKPMSSFIYFAAGGIWSDPSFDYNGTLEFFNLMRGRLPGPPYPSAEPFPESVADVTPYGTYLLDGDPVSNSGKIDGVVDLPGDRRIMVINGPVSMNLGDTVQVALALVGAFGTDNLSSISKLKQHAFDIQQFYHNGIITDVKDEIKSVPTRFALEQNYPNPFNPSTKIKYRLSMLSKVKLEIYDVLGRNVKTLVNKTQNAGDYQITFDASQLSSGVYFYRLSANSGASNFTSVKKMILLR